MAGVDGFLSAVNSLAELGRLAEKLVNAVATMDVKSRDQFISLIGAAFDQLESADTPEKKLDVIKQLQDLMASRVSG